MKRIKFILFFGVVIAFLCTYTIPSYSSWNYENLRKAVVQIYRPDLKVGTGFIVQ